MWLKNQSFQKLGGGRMERFTLRMWSRLQMSALKARKDPEIVSQLTEIYRQQRSLLSAWEQYMIYSLAKAQAALPGAMAEVGVFRGGSARLICEVKGDKPFLLFDTFAGLPPSSAEDRNVHREHQYSCSLENVQQFLSGYENLHYYPGIFPTSTTNVPEQQYCFAHFDVDLYDGTKACLEYFYPRMVTGGVMVSHDYGLLAGVEQAFQEFFADKPERIIDLPSTQCMIIKQ
jgi:O-methyltransferase